MEQRDSGTAEQRNSLAEYWYGGTQNDDGLVGGAGEIGKPGTEPEREKLKQDRLHDIYSAGAAALVGFGPVLVEVGNAD